MIFGTKKRWIALERYRHVGKFWSIRWPSSNYGQIELRMDSESITISNNIGGQLGPRTIRRGIYWGEFRKHGIRFG